MSDMDNIRELSSLWTEYALAIDIIDLNCLMVNDLYVHCVDSGFESERCHVNHT